MENQWLEERQGYLMLLWVMRDIHTLSSREWIVRTWSRIWFWDRWGRSSSRETLKIQEICEGSRQPTAKRWWLLCEKIL